MPERKDKEVCYFCRKKCTRQSFCYGCEHFVCSDCDEAGIDLPRKHEVDDHQY